MPRALKLTLIAALKIITKQQEAADVMGPCTVAENSLMPGEIYSGGQSPNSSENIDLILPLKRGFHSYFLYPAYPPFAVAAAAHLSGTAAAHHH